jgi:RNA polymerase sigma-70 factor (ECF subfamily)
MGVPSPEDLVARVLQGDEPIRGEIWAHRQYLDAVALTARTGDRDAREALWLAVRPRLERVAGGSGVHPCDIPDLVQDTVLSANQNLARFDPDRGSFRTWVIAILFHLRSNMWRTRARRRRALADLRRQSGSNGNGNGRGGLEPMEARVQLDRLLPKLSRRQRAVLVLYDIGGLSAYETGLVLGITPAGVRSIAREARNRLSAHVNGKR